MQKILSKIPSTLNSCLATLFETPKDVANAGVDYITCHDAKIDVIFAAFRKMIPNSNYVLPTCAVDRKDVLLGDAASRE